MDDVGLYDPDRKPIKFAQMTNAEAAPKRIGHRQSTTSPTSTRSTTACSPTASAPSSNSASCRRRWPPTPTPCTPSGTSRTSLRPRDYDALGQHDHRLRPASRRPLRHRRSRAMGLRSLERAQHRLLGRQPQAANLLRALRPHRPRHQEGQQPPPRRRPLDRAGRLGRGLPRALQAEQHPGRLRQHPRLRQRHRQERPRHRRADSPRQDGLPRRRRWCTTRSPPRPIRKCRSS